MVLNEYLFELKDLSVGLAPLKIPYPLYIFNSNFFNSIMGIDILYHTIALISHTSKVILKILQARLQQYKSRELPDVQAGFRKGRGTGDQIANICWIIEKSREFQKNICFIDYAKVFVWITTNCGKFLKRWEYHTT